jgi:Zn-dependent protease with chaperone function
MRLLLVPLLAVAAAASACRSAPKLNESQEYFMGRAVAALAIEKDQLYTGDEALERYVSMIGFSVAFESDRPETYKGYTFGILNSDAVNAFCAPSGFIFVTKGLLRQMSNEAELAGVLAHEIAHIGLRHPEIAAQAAADKEGLSEYAGAFQQGMSILGGIAAYRGYGGAASAAQLASEAAPLMGKAAQGLHESFSNGFSRDEEFAADAKAVEFMSREGVRYSPEAYQAFIGRLPSKGGAYGTHPDLAMLHPHRARAQLSDRPQVVRYDDQCPARRVIPGELRQAAPPERLVPDCQYFVEQQNIGVGADGYGKRKPRTHPGGVVLHRDMHEVADVGERHDMGIPLRNFPASEAKRRGIQLDVLRSGKLGLEGRAKLEHGDESAAHDDAPLCRWIDACHQSQRRALA